MAEMREKVKGAIDDAAHAGKNLTDKAANAADRAANHGQQSGNDIAGTVSNVAGQVQDKAQQWAGDVADTAEKYGKQAQRWVGDNVGQMPDSFGEFSNELTSLVRKHPIPALLIGFGVGLLIGRTATRA